MPHGSRYVLHGDQAPCGVGRHHSLGGLGFAPLWPRAPPQLLSPGPNPEGQRRTVVSSPEANAGQSSSPRHLVVTFFVTVTGPNPKTLGPSPGSSSRSDYGLALKARTMCTGPVVVVTALIGLYIFDILAGKGLPGQLAGKGLPGLGDLRALQGSRGAQGYRLPPWAVRGDRLAP